MNNNEGGIMNVTIDLKAIARKAHEYQETNGDYSYPFWMAFRDLYAEEGDLAAFLLEQNFPIEEQNE